QPMPVARPSLPEPSVFRISPLISGTLSSLYFVLTIPLLFLLPASGTRTSAGWLLLGIAIGAMALGAVLSEQVILDSQGIRVAYPRWVPHFFRHGWFLSWREIQGLEPRSTSQGGLVYYLLSSSGQAYLLPMRVAGFTRLVRQVEAYTGIDTEAVRPLAQPWMYLILLLFTLLLFLVDGWFIWVSLTQAQT
ncbi:MAG TPA: hypothetical protein V6D03_10695, partial [Candidatus Caenarcaniphilales bacterium]